MDSSSVYETRAVNSPLSGKETIINLIWICMCRWMILCKSHGCGFGPRGRREGWCPGLLAPTDKERKREKKGNREGERACNIFFLSHLWKLVVGGGHLHILMLHSGEGYIVPPPQSLDVAGNTPPPLVVFLSSICTMVRLFLFPLFRPFLLWPPTIISSLLFTRHIYPYFWHFCPSFPKKIPQIRKKKKKRGSTGCGGGGRTHPSQCIYMTIFSLFPRH